MISVIIPLYNKALSIEKTINSVLQQSYANFELIIVDDGSTDASAEVVEKIQDNRIKLIKKKNGGVSSARNLGIRETKFNYLIFLDADDLWTIHHLQEFIKMIKYDDDIRFYATSFTKDREKFKFGNSKSVLKVINDFYLEESYATTILSSSSFGFRKDILDHLDYYYNEKFKYGEDVDFWYRILQGNQLVHSELITVLYNIEGENRSDFVLPIKFRFHNFVFKNKSENEKKYLGKLVALVIIDYIYFKSYRISLNVFLKYFSQIKYISRYFYLLLMKKLGRS